MSLVDLAQDDLFPPIITLLSATSSHCRFPIEMKDGDLVVCGKTPLLGKPYCIKCCKIAYQPIRPPAQSKHDITKMERLSGATRIFG